VYSFSSSFPPSFRCALIALVCLECETEERSREDTEEMSREDTEKRRGVERRGVGSREE
jgi:hypothetical protein